MNKMTTKKLASSVLAPELGVKKEIISCKFLIFLTVVNDS